MKARNVLIPETETAKQGEFMNLVRSHVMEHGGGCAYVDTYGCQQNEADSERLRGLLSQMGYSIVEESERADVIIINSCAIREHAEHRVLGNVGALVHGKREKPNQIICFCGCMAAEPHIVEKIKKSFRHVSLLFPPDALWRFPELLWTALTSGKRTFIPQNTEGVIAENMPVLRMSSIKAWVSIMYGCNNFCSYCIVPYVRGRERSRSAYAILEEVRQLAQTGYKDITLLGQNVNSYGKYSDDGIDFPRLLREINDIPGDFLIRFMTSHPKDATKELFDAMAECPKVAHHIHLPFQAGDNDILKKMNRGYTFEKYLELINYARSVMPDLVLTSDVIVGFPGETKEQFEETLRLIETVRFDSLFTFIFSPREGTPAAKLPDPVSRSEKLDWFNRLLEVQNNISLEKHLEYVGKTVRVLIDGEGTGARNLAARTNGGRLVHINGDKALIGSYADVKITEASTWALFGDLI